MQSLKIQQVLHGYADGHRQLAVSTQLRPRDAKLMLTLSDLSGPGVQIEDGGYLTGYPLSESKMYAIARTWPAPEMPRPGCVWTHTLLIDFADIAALADVSLINQLFRRPTSIDTSEYRKSLGVSLGSQIKVLPLEAEPFARRLLAALYSQPNSRVIAARAVGVDVDTVVTGVWNQQWPRLRRAFRFCTFSSADRSSDGISFDLQLLPSLDRSTRTRFASAIEATDVGGEEQWLQEAVSDLINPGTSDLRSFLRRIGGDVDLGRGAFRPLCRLHALIDQFDTEPDNVNFAIDLLEKDLGSTQARAARGVVASAVFKNSDHLDELAIDFLVRNLDLVEPGIIAKYGTTLGARIWEHNPARFAEFLQGDKRQRSIAENGVASMDISALSGGIVRAPQLSEAIVSLRPELITIEDVWRHGAVSPETGFAVLSKMPELRAAAVGAMILADRLDLAIPVVREIGALPLLEIIATKVNAVRDQRSVETWLRAALYDPSEVAKFLSRQIDISWAVLSGIAALMPPDAVPNDFGADPWLLAIEALSPSERSDLPVFLSAYLLSRALGGRSRSPGQLAQLAFVRVHESARLDSLPENAWNLLQPRLPWSFNWFDWDRCPRIRSAVAELFVERDLQPHLFAESTSDESIFTALVETVGRNNRGRNFLKRVRRWMKEEDRATFRGRIHIIDNFLN